MFIWDGEGVSLCRSARVKPTVKVMFKERPEGSKGNSSQAICEQGTPGRRKSKWKEP